MNMPQTQDAPRVAEPALQPEQSPLGRYVGLFAWILAIAVLLMIPLHIIGTGFIPGGDARRHVAKAFTDKPYNQIIVFNSYYKTDQSPGWEWLLKILHRDAGWGREALASFSIISMMLCVFYAPLPWLRRPEAWLAALLAQAVAIPAIMVRLDQARPFLITEGVLIAILFTWPKTSKPSWTKIILTTVGMTLSVWMHGTWYLWALPIMAFALAQAWSLAFWLTGCFATGTLVGALMTGHPADFFVQQVMQVVAIMHDHAPQWMLVGEFQPMDGEFETLVVIGGVILWRWFQAGRRPKLFSDPVFLLIAMCWVLGFKADRFWADWAVPAVIVWLAMQFEEILPTLCEAGSLKRVMLCGMVAVPLFWQTTNDLGRRYSMTQIETFVRADDPSLQGWFPDHDGIFYFANMEFFYDTFYVNPDGDWRYVMGMEPAMMREDDLKIFRQIQQYHYAPEAFQPWADKMLPADRLVIYSAVQPNLPKLEWHRAQPGVWIGRLPRSTRTPKENSGG